MGMKHETRVNIPVPAFASTLAHKTHTHTWLTRHTVEWVECKISSNIILFVVRLDSIARNICSPFICAHGDIVSTLWKLPFFVANTNASCRILTAPATVKPNYLFIFTPSCVCWNRRREKKWILHSKRNAKTMHNIVHPFDIEIMGEKIWV